MGWGVDEEALGIPWTILERSSVNFRRATFFSLL